MATGDRYLSISENRLLGWQSLKNLFFDYLEKQGRTMAERVYATGSTFGTATQLVADGNRKFKLSGYPTGTVSAVDGQGRFLDFRERTEDIEEIQFENSLGVEYEVAVRQAPLPGGLFVNPADGNPIWNYYEDIVGVAGTPDSVTDNGDGTLTFVVDGITEAARDNSGRQVYVYKNTITKNAFTEQLAKQLCTTTYSGGNNKITTTLPGAGGAGTFGQVVASTTASHYTVILVGPRVAVGLDLLHDSDYCFIGTVTGAGGTTPPSTFYVGDQNCYDFDLTLLSDITRLEGASGTDRLKVDVKVIPGDSATDQIRVTNSALSPAYRFKVDGLGNVTIEGNLTVTGTTYQHNIEQYNATTATIDNLTAGNADTDAQAFKGEMTHTHGTGPAVTDFQIDGATGELGIGAAKETGVNVKLGGRVLHKVSTNPFFEIDSTGRVGLGGLADTDSTPVAVRLYGRVLHKVSSTPYFEIASDGKVGIGGAVDSAYQTLFTGSLVHKAGGSTQYFAIESDGRIGLGGPAEASVAVKMTGRYLHKGGGSTSYFEIGSDGKVGIGGAVDATYQNLLTGTTAHKTSSTVNFEIDPAGYVGIGGVHEDTFALKVTGNMKVTGSLTAGAYTMSGDLDPGTPNTYEIGDETNYWKWVIAATGQFSNLKSRDHLVDITVFNSLLSNGTSLTLGSGTYYWGAVYASDAYHLTLRPRTGSDMTVYGNLLMSGSSAWTLGNVTTRLGTGWMTTANIGTLQNDSSSIAIGDSMVPAGSHTTLTLGASGNRFDTGFLNRLHTTYLKNESSDITLESNLVMVDGSRVIGSSGNKVNTGWFTTLEVGTIQNTGANPVSFADTVRPSSDNYYELGADSLRWANIFSRFSTLQSPNWENPPVQFYRIPDTDLTYNEHYWRILSSLIGSYNGCFLIQGLDDTDVPNFNILKAWWHSGGANWVDIGPVDNIYLCGGTVWVDSYDVLPYTDNDTFLGGASNAWQGVYAYNYFAPGSHYHTSFDDYDDLALVDQYAPSGEHVTRKNAGVERQVQVAKPGTMPWPMMNEDGTAMNLAASMSFLLGAIKQLHQKVKDQAEEIARLQLQPA